ncbi:PadR family transcriptional regulator [Ornithinibacillus halotolerans]|uniref:Transcription regulator PadR N-terminal domain-containing protein n=1 Tax=Ornithinibacillus halotolerans TaxID=1274357 RepID=A0A916WAK7_9BACI|nr:PadR family transcriptional regulator [Ornithinibacillus halotolerans]GGA80401.1 hypothetical protein GCM10008025_24750 [Ornithinibacillus halotolerans]
MNNSLSNLKRSMKESVFKEFSFPEERKNAVKEEINGKQAKHQLHAWKEKTIIAVLETIQNQPKHGFDISTNLFQKQDFAFKSNEGELYALLHVLENKSIITSTWIEDKKYYSLSKKGKKLLVTYKEESPKLSLILLDIIQEAAL